MRFSLRQSDTSYQVGVARVVTNQSKKSKGRHEAINILLLWSKERAVSISQFGIQARKLDAGGLPGEEYSGRGLAQKRLLPSPPTGAGGAGVNVALDQEGRFFTFFREVFFPKRAPPPPPPGF